MFPYLDLSGFERRTAMPLVEVRFVENDTPGYTASRIAVRSSYINGRLRKRYGAGANNSLPLGQRAPLLLGAGTNPPEVILTGRPTLGSMQLLVTITTGGALGTALFKWSADNGITWTVGVTTGVVVLAGTGLTATFGVGTYSTDNQYAAATPVPEIVLNWLQLMVTYDLYRRRGANPQDPQMQWLVDEKTQAEAELKEASDSKDGLFDLPMSEDEDSAVTTGGPLIDAQTSPYTWTDIEACLGRQQDAGGLGGFE